MASLPLKPADMPAAAPRDSDHCLSLSVVVPAFNEARRIKATLTRITSYLTQRGTTFEILVVNDGSADETAQIVTAFAAAHPEVRLLEYAENQGKGYAVRYGMLRARGARILFSDADLATPIEEIEKLEAALAAGAAVAIGSRDVPGSALERRESLLRETAGKLFNRFVQFLAVPGIRDTQCGFKLFTREAARRIFSGCQVNNFAFDVESLFLARKLGYLIAEVPIRWVHQEGSKVHVLRDGIRMLRTVLTIRRTPYKVSASETLASDTSASDTPASEALREI